MSAPRLHIPVLFDQVMAGLRPVPAGRYVDGTVGLGGHARGILERTAPDGLLLAIDRDPEAVRLAGEALREYGSRVTLRQGQLRDLDALARGAGFERLSGVLMDLGVSSLQLNRPERGFSFQQEGPLDMRMGPDADLTAEEIVNRWPERELARVIYEYGEDRASRRIARAIVAARPLRTTRQLADVVARAAGRKGEERIHPATRTFQALRIVVNDELDGLREALPQAVDLLAPGGRLAVIAFHSLEDRIVKQYLAREARGCICPPQIPQCVCGHTSRVVLVTRKPLQASAEEVARNPRSRSARLRIAERLP